MKNCQFKAIRENTLISDHLKNTHARQFKINPMGGAAGVKNVKFLQMIGLSNLNNLVPIRQIQNIVKSPQKEPKKTEKKKIDKKKEKERKELLNSKASCDLVRTYNPPNPQKQPSVMQ